MSIVASCKCGKRFKAKDSMAGRKVRCPHCKNPIRIPGPKGGSAVPAGKAGQGVDAEAAILKFEEAQKKKALTAEEEAAYREEQNKLIESYDQVAGKHKKDKKKKGRLEEGRPKKVTVFTKLADALATIFGTYAAKYIMIAALIGGGAYGSAKLWTYVGAYTSGETDVGQPKQVRIREIYKQIPLLLKERKFDEANDALDEVIRLDPTKETHRTYQHWRKRLQEAFNAQ